MGIRGLFLCPSSTVRIVAAEILAAHLEVDLYRIDLARVVSKYIGEREKNLDRVFDAAEGSGAIPFFDEADALFGRRSEVRASHYRYANREINRCATAGFRLSAATPSLSVLSGNPLPRGTP